MPNSTRSTKPAAKKSAAKKAPAVKAKAAVTVAGGDETVRVVVHAISREEATAMAKLKKLPDGVAKAFAVALEDDESDTLRVVMEIPRSQVVALAGDLSEDTAASLLAALREHV